MVTSFCNSTVYLEDLPDLVLSQATADVSVEISIDGVKQVEEIYSPDANGIVRVGMLADFCRAFFDINMPSVDVGDTVTTHLSKTLSIKATSGNEVKTVSTEVFYSRERIGITPGAAFLTTAGEKNISDEVFYFSLVKIACQLKFYVYFSDNTSKFYVQNVAASATHDILTFAYNRAELFSEYADDEDVDVVKFMVELKVDNVVKDTFVVNFVDEDLYSKNVVFGNTFGVPDVINFCGSETETINYKSELSTILAKQRLLNEIHHTDYSLVGMFSEANYRLACEICGSDYVMLAEDDELRDIVVTEFTNEYKVPKEKPGVVTVGYRYSQRPALKIYRKDRYAGLFAKTFTPVFD